MALVHAHRAEQQRYQEGVDCWGAWGLQPGAAGLQLAKQTCLRWVMDKWPVFIQSEVNYLQRLSITFTYRSLTNGRFRSHLIKKKASLKGRGGFSCGLSHVTFTNQPFSMMENILLFWNEVDDTKVKSLQPVWKSRCLWQVDPQPKSIGCA